MESIIHQTSKITKKYDDLKKMIINIYEEQSLERFEQEYKKHRNMITHDVKVELLKYFQHDKDIIKFIN